MVESTPVLEYAQREITFLNCETHSQFPANFFDQTQSKLFCAKCLREGKTSYETTVEADDYCIQEFKLWEQLVEKIVDRDNKNKLL